MPAAKLIRAPYGSSTRQLWQGLGPVAMMGAFLTFASLLLATSPTLRSWLVSCVALNDPTHLQRSRARHSRHAVRSARVPVREFIVVDTTTGEDSEPLPAVAPAGSPAQRLLAERCEQNLQLLAVALNNYYRGHDHVYPTRLSDVVREGYLHRLPRCPAAHADTYSASYRCNNKYETFTICCHGHSHASAGLAQDFPRRVKPGRLVVR